MPKDFSERIKEANSHLDRVRIREKSGRLYVRSSQFPVKPGDESGKQYEISCKARATPAGLKAAIAITTVFAR
ncbi:MAG: hypothetical protein ACFE0J_04845 [Elainellaceae cyanobacterium]